jgi:hypothetical protein
MWHAYERNSEGIVVANENEKFNLEDLGLACRAILTGILSCDVDCAHLVHNRPVAVWRLHGKKRFGRS